MFDYKLVRSARKTLTICITDGELIVKAPARASVRHIEAFIAQKSAWIQKKLAEHERKTAALAPVTDGTHILYHGVPLRIEPSSSVKRVKLEVGAVLVPAKYDSEDARARAVTAFFKRLASKELASALEARACGSGLHYGEFATTNARTKWGSCDGKCNIRLNWRLVMLDAELVDYVIVHELCHTLHHDHSREFWAEVERLRPSYKSDKMRLKTFSVLTSMFRT